MLLEMVVIPPSGDNQQESAFPPGATAADRSHIEEQL
jgi:hypothetical protein